MSLSHTYVISPVGKLKLVASKTGLVALLWENDHPRRFPRVEMVEDHQHTILLETRRQLTEYFAGKRTTFSIPLEMRGTPFQKEVWRALQTIPCGQTMSYGNIARQLGNPAATRAVGAANSRNPISIIIPCHRVVGATGRLTGFAGGLKAKAHLLQLECPNYLLADMEP